MLIADMVRNFHTAPFLFVGSGLSRRYLGLPNWEGLLQHFVNRIGDDQYAYQRYLTQAEDYNSSAGVLPYAATLIESDFNSRWFKDPTFRVESETYLKTVISGVSPFKMAVSDYISSFTDFCPKYQAEISKLSELTKRSLSGIITTNYDCLLEGLADNYTTYIGQEELIFSPIQGIAEIYKIHGSITAPSTITIDEKDYILFNRKSTYLAAKLLTIFMEYPIIFLGYSLADSNIRQILLSIVDCLPSEKLIQLQDRFIFINYVPDLSVPEVHPHSFVFDSKELRMTQISLSDFSLLYDALSTIRTKIPVRIMRTFKQEFYDFTLTNEPTTRMRLANVDAEELDGEDLALVFGRISEVGLFGLTGISANDWYRDIIMDDLAYSADDILEFAFPYLLPKTSILPVYKHLAHATKSFPQCAMHADQTASSFNKIISTSFQKAQKNNPYYSIAQIANAPDLTFEKRTRLMAELPEPRIEVEHLYRFLKGLFEKSAEILETSIQAERTNIRRLIRLYDYLRYKR